MVKAVKTADELHAMIQLELDGMSDVLKEKTGNPNLIVTAPQPTWHERDEAGVNWQVTYTDLTTEPYAASVLLVAGRLQAQFDMPEPT